MMLDSTQVFLEGVFVFKEGKLLYALRSGMDLVDLDVKTLAPIC